ncbi:MAG: hypothetical protein M1815_001928 [Lichina confinis]|nr:MAG: hypothetical protein M1815_001928 [Lichina confinis]
MGKADGTRTGEDESKSDETISVGPTGRDGRRCGSTMRRAIDESPGTDGYSVGRERRRPATTVAREPAKRAQRRRPSYEYEQLSSYPTVPLSSYPTTAKVDVNRERQREPARGDAPML